MDEVLEIDGTEILTELLINGREVSLVLEIDGTEISTELIIPSS